MPRDIEESLPDFNKIDYDEISDFLTRTGAVELISLLDRQGYRFDEIDQLLDASRGTLHKRRDEAVGLGLIMPDQALRDDNVRRVFIPTAIGDGLKWEMRRIGITQSHERLRNVRQEYETHKQQFIDWTEDTNEFKEDLENNLIKQGISAELFENEE